MQWLCPPCHPRPRVVATRALTIGPTLRRTTYCRTPSQSLPLYLSMKAMALTWATASCRSTQQWSRSSLTHWPYPSSSSSSKSSCRSSSYNRPYIIEDSLLSNPKLVTATTATGGGNGDDVSYYIASLHLVMVMAEPDVLTMSSSSLSKSSYRSSSYRLSCIT